MFACALAWLGVVIVAFNGAQYVRELLTDPSLLYNLKGHHKWAYPLVVFIPFAIAQLRLPQWENRRFLASGASDRILHGNRLGCSGGRGSPFLPSSHFGDVLNSTVGRSPALSSSHVCWR